jgi:hypothetical protein
MSRGPGHVERAIAAAFKEAPPGTTFSVAELAALAYPDEVRPVVRRVQRRWYHRDVPSLSVTRAHRVAVKRAAFKVAPPLWWDWRHQSAREGEIIFYDRCDALSIAMAGVRQRYWDKDLEFCQQKLEAGDLGHHWRSLEGCRQQAEKAMAEREEARAQGGFVSVADVAAPIGSQHL